MTNTYKLFFFGGGGGYRISILHPLPILLLDFLVIKGWSKKDQESISTGAHVFLLNSPMMVTHRKSAKILNPFTLWKAVFIFCFNFSFCLTSTELEQITELNRKIDHKFSAFALYFFKNYLLNFFMYSSMSIS